MIKVLEDSLFKFGNAIKYISPWDSMFKKDKYNGCLNFYNGNPSYIVCVEILKKKRDNLQQEDIIIVLGEHHNGKNVKDLIRENETHIFEFCKATTQNKFALDLEKLKTVEKEDFNSFIPSYGLNTLFMFENIPDTYYCLVNPTGSLPNTEFYSWLLSYIYSSVVCLTPKGKIEEFSKKYMQALSILCFTRGNLQAVRISKSASALNCELTDIGEVLLPIPGDNTNRLETLAVKSLEQMKLHLEKERKAMG
jgi:hypothetical protein